MDLLSVQKHGMNGVSTVDSAEITFPRPSERTFRLETNRMLKWTTERTARRRESDEQASERARLKETNGRPREWGAGTPL